MVAGDAETVIVGGGAGVGFGLDKAVVETATPTTQVSKRGMT